MRTNKKEKLAERLAVVMKKNKIIIIGTCFEWRKILTFIKTSAHTIHLCVIEVRTKRVICQAYEGHHARLYMYHIIYIRHLKITKTMMLRYCRCC